MNIQLVGAACSVGGKHRGCRLGPAVFQRRAFSALQRSAQHRYQWYGTEAEHAFLGAHRRIKPDTSVGGNPHAMGAASAVVYDCCRRLQRSVRDVCYRHEFPVVIGGDHSCAIGTWHGVAQAQRGPIGLLWIDAHMDCHTPSSSCSGDIHGMPVAYLLGKADTALFRDVQRGAVISAAHTCLLGVRSFEAPELALLKEQGVTLFTMDQIAQLGLNKVLSLAYAKVAACPTGFGISIDLDAVDPKDAPGVSVPEGDGIALDCLTSALRSLPRSRRLRAIEIAEFNPELDVNGKTAKAIVQLIRSLLH